MSWDIMIFSSNEKIVSIEDLDDEQLVPINFSQILQEYFVDAVKEGNLISIKEENYSISFFTDEEIISHKLISIIGEKGLLKIVDLAKEQNWQIFDLELGEMLDLNNPERNGYKNFKEFVQQIANDNN